MLQYIKVPIDATFYRVYGDYIADKTRNAKQATHLKCFDFNAYVSRRLADKGFTGSIKKGLLGTTTLAGHEFLLLFWECEARYRRILDVWSHLQTGRPALCIETDYAALLPQDKALQAALVKGVVPKLELKNGTCPTSGS